MVQEMINKERERHPNDNFYIRIKSDQESSEPGELINLDLRD